MGCFVVAEFLLTSASRGPSAIAEPLVAAICTMLRQKKALILVMLYNDNIVYKAHVTLSTVEEISDWGDRWLPG